MSSICKYHLHQESPMWHFQYREKDKQAGAILRGSDVKPRFDKFLINQMKNEKVNWEAFRLSNQHNALDYKIKIRALGRPKENEDMGEKAFFANMGQEDKELSVFYPEGVELTISCFIPDLMKEIDKHIEAFFVIHNFGTRQDKGFGSFVIDKKGNNKVETDIESTLRSYCSSELFFAYKVIVDKCTDKKILNSAYTLYQWMKSGINQGKPYQKSLLTKYMLSRKIGGEKRWMKETGIAPKVKKDPAGTKSKVIDDREPDGEVKEYKYIRAVLGVSGPQRWFTDKGYPAIINISSKNIDRFQSPITIKCIGNSVYFLVYDISKDNYKDIFNKEFKFNNKNKEGVITTPDNFDMKSFMDYCIKETKGKEIIIRKNRYRFLIKKIEGGVN